MNDVPIPSLPQIYEELYHTINNSDHQKDLKWWSNNHGVNMAMNWPSFVVCVGSYCLTNFFNPALFHLTVIFASKLYFCIECRDLTNFVFKLIFFV